jgi:lipoprotein NlpD
MMKKISLIFTIIFLSSCSDDKVNRVVIVDKSINKYQNNNINNLAIKDKKLLVADKNIAAKLTSSNKNITQKTIKKSNEKIKNQQWISPIDAIVFKGFSTNNKGITFDNKDNQSVVAIADGEVVYSGNSLKSFGYMIIIKHKYGFYSHYMFNKKTIVDVGSKVLQGKKIAITGKSKFHLSMKKFTTSVNPSKYINF